MHDATSYAGTAVHSLQLDMRALHERRRQPHSSSSTRHGQTPVATPRLGGTPRRATARAGAEGGDGDNGCSMAPLLTLHGHFRCAAVVPLCSSPRHAAPPPLATSYVIESTPDRTQTTRASSPSLGGSPAPVRQAGVAHAAGSDVGRRALRDGEAAEPHAAARPTQSASSSNLVGGAAEAAGRQAKTRHARATSALGEEVSSTSRNDRKEAEEAGSSGSSAGTVLLAAECSHGITATTVTTNASSCYQVGTESGGGPGGGGARSASVAEPAVPTTLLPTSEAAATYGDEAQRVAASRPRANAARGPSWSRRVAGRHVNGARHPCRLLRSVTPGTTRLAKASAERAGEAQTGGAVRRLSSVASSSVVTVHPNGVTTSSPVPYRASRTRRNERGLMSFVRDESVVVHGNVLHSVATADTHAAAAAAATADELPSPSCTLWLAGKDGGIEVHDMAAPSRVLRAWRAQGQRASGRGAAKSAAVVVVTTLAALAGQTNRVAAGLSDGTLQVYCAATMALLATTRAHTAAVTCVLPVPPPCTRSISALRDGEEGGTSCLKTADAQTDAAVQEVTLLTSSLDGTLARWRVADGLTCVVRLRGSWCGVHALALAACGAFAISGSDNGALRMWNLVQHTQVELDKAEKAILAAHSASELPPSHHPTRSTSPRLCAADAHVSPARRRNNVCDVHDYAHGLCETARSDTSESLSTRSVQILRASAAAKAGHDGSNNARTGTPEPRHPTSPAAPRSLSLGRLGAQPQPQRMPSQSQPRRRRVVTATTSMPRPAPSRESRPRAMSVGRIRHVAQPRTPYMTALAPASPSQAALLCEESTAQAVKKRAARMAERPAPPPGPPPPALEQKLRRVVRGFVAGRACGALASRVARAHAEVAFDDATRLRWPLDQAHQQCVTALLVVADRLLVSASRDGLGNVFALPTGQHLRTLSLPHKMPLTAALLDTVRGVVWLGGTDGSLAGYDACAAAMPLVHLVRPSTVQAASTFAVLSSYRTHFFYVFDQPADSAAQARRVVCAEQCNGLVEQVRQGDALDMGDDEEEESRAAQLRAIAEGPLGALAGKLSVRQQAARALQAAKAKMAAMGTIEDMELADMRLCGRVMQRQHIRVFLQRAYCTWRGWAARRAMCRRRGAQAAVMASALASCLRCHYWTRWRRGVLQRRDARLSRRCATQGVMTAAQSVIALDRPAMLMRGVFDETRALLHATRRVTARHTAHMVTVGAARTMLYTYFCSWREGAELALRRSRRATSYNTLLLSFAGPPYCAASTLLTALTRRAVRKAWQDKAVWLLQRRYAATAQHALRGRYFAQWQHQASVPAWPHTAPHEARRSTERRASAGAVEASGEDEDAWALVEPLSCILVRREELRRRCFHRWLDYSRHVTREARLAEEKLTLRRERVLLQNILDNPLSSNELTHEVKETQATIAGLLLQRERTEFAERKLRQEIAGLRVRDALDVLLAGYDVRWPATTAAALSRSMTRGAYSATTTPRAWHTRSLPRNSNDDNGAATSVILSSTAAATTSEAHRRTRSWGAVPVTHDDVAGQVPRGELVARSELLLRMVHAVMRALKALALHCGRDEKEIVKAYALALRLPVLEPAPDAGECTMSYDAEGSLMAATRRGQGRRGGGTAVRLDARARRPSLTTGTPRNAWAASSPAATSAAPMTPVLSHAPGTSSAASYAASAQAGGAALTGDSDTLRYSSLAAAFDDTVDKLQELLRTMAAEAGATLELEALPAESEDWVVSALLQRKANGSTGAEAAAANAAPLTQMATLRMADGGAGAAMDSASRSESMGTQSGQANNHTASAAAANNNNNNSHSHNNHNNTSISTLSALDEAAMTDEPHLLQLARPSITRSTSAQSATAQPQPMTVMVIAAGSDGAGNKDTTDATQHDGTANAQVSGTGVTTLPRWLQHVSLTARRAVAALTVRLVALYDTFVAHSEMALERAATFSTRGQSDTRALPLCTLCSERSASLLLRLATLLLGIAQPQLWQRQIKLHEMHVMAAKARAEAAAAHVVAPPLSQPMPQPRSRRVPVEPSSQAGTTWLYKADSHKSADGATTPSVSVCRDDSPQPHRVPWSSSATETGIRVPPIPIAAATAAAATAMGPARPQLHLSSRLLRSPATSNASSSVVFNTAAAEEGKSGLVERSRNDNNAQQQQQQLMQQYGSAPLCGEAGGPQMGTPDEDQCGHTRSTSFSVRAFSVASTPHSSAVTPRSVHSAAQHVARPYLGFRVNVGRDAETGRPSISIREVVESFLNAAGEEVRGPAAAAGLHAGDQLLRFAGYAVTDLAAFNAIVSRHVRNGAELGVVVRRRGEEVSTTIRVGTRVC